MPGLATRETNRSVQAFLETIENSSKRIDSTLIIELMEQVTGHPPKIWGNDKVPDFIIGFGKYAYRRKGGKEDLEWFNVGFAPRKTKLTIYLTFDIGRQDNLLRSLGKCKWGKGCLYINKLADIDIGVLRQLIEIGKDARWH